MVFTPAAWLEGAEASPCAQGPTTLSHAGQGSSRGQPQIRGANPNSPHPRGCCHSSWSQTPGAKQSLWLDLSKASKGNF